MDKKQKAIDDMVEAARALVAAHNGQKKALKGSYALLAGYAKEFVEWQEKSKELSTPGAMVNE